MASGKVHNLITTMAAPFVVLGVGWATGDIASSAAAGGGCTLGIFVTPDWDLDAHAPWWRLPYAKIFRHRGLSHTPIVGTLGRLLYLGWPLVLAWVAWMALAEPGLTTPVIIPPGLPMLVVWAVIGLMVADTLHWVADWKIWVLFRARRRPRRRPRFPRW